jgi:hypothetical protein
MNGYVNFHNRQKYARYMLKEIKYCGKINKIGCRNLLIVKMKLFLKELIFHFNYGNIQKL